MTPEDIPHSKRALPSISIITPSYQQGQFIEETIQSIITQNYPDLEFFIIDGGSNDQTVDIIKKYEDQITSWVSEPDDGQTHAINKGFRIATGDIVTWINSDDLLTPGALLKVGEFFRDNPDIQVLYGDGIAIDRNGEKLYARRPGGFDLEWFIRTDYILQPSGFFRRSLLKELEFLDEHLHYAMDTDIYLRMALRSKLVYLPLVLSKFRLYPEAKTSEGRYPFTLDIIYIIDKILRSGEYSAEITGALMSSLFWRVMEACLERDTSESLHPGNHDEVRNCVERYEKIMKLVFIGIMSNDTHLYQKTLVQGHDIIVQAADLEETQSSDGKIDWVIKQGVDSLVYAARVASKGKVDQALRLGITVFLIYPKIITNINFLKILISVKSGILK